MMDHTTLIPSFLADAVNETLSSVYAPAATTSSDDGLYGVEGIFSTIYLKGRLLGKMSLFIKPSAAARIVAAMLDVEELNEESPETLDGTGEVLNMIVGCFKKRLASQNISVELSVPSTRLTSVIPPARWDQSVDMVFQSGDVRFKVLLSYRLAAAEEKPSEPPAKPKLSAAELLKMAMARKK